MHHLKERAEMIQKRRSGDDEDDLSLFFGAPAPADQGVDDLGRSINVESGPSSAGRRARRSERDSRRTKRKSRQNKTTETEEGYSTDSSLAEGDAGDYAAATRDLRKRVTGLLEDVRAEDFKNPEKGVAVKFGEWRQKYEEEYVSAFGGLAMVQAWEFYARGEMIGWEPLRVSSQACHSPSHKLMVVINTARIIRVVPRLARLLASPPAAVTNRFRGRHGRGRIPPRT